MHNVRPARLAVPQQGKWTDESDCNMCESVGEIEG